MSLNLFGTAVPTLLTEADNTYNLGTEIVFARDVWVVGGRRYASTQALGTVPFHHLWTPAGVELARKQYGANTPGAWNSVLYDTRILVEAGTTVVTAYGPVDRYVATVDLLDVPLINGDVTAPANGTGGVVNGRYVVNAAVTFPGESGGGNCYFADILFGDLKTGVVSSVLGELIAEVNSTVSSVAPASTSGGSGGWYGLMDLLRGNAAIVEAEAGRQPSACPLCGEPLRAGPRGGLYCSFDGWRYDGA